MKNKVITLAVNALLLSLTTSAQDATTKPQSFNNNISRQASEPVVNGIPYSQWKAKCEKEKAVQQEQERNEIAEAAKEKSPMQGATKMQSNVISTGKLDTRMQSSTDDVASKTLANPTVEPNKSKPNTKKVDESKEK
jgi:hypothetical protein